MFASSVTIPPFAGGCQQEFGLLAGNGESGESFFMAFLCLPVKLMWYDKGRLHLFKGLQHSRFASRIWGLFIC